MPKDFQKLIQEDMEYDLKKKIVEDNKKAINSINNIGIFLDIIK